jgi:hypothetical protein
MSDENVIAPAVPWNVDRRSSVGAGTMPDSPFEETG